MLNRNYKSIVPISNNNGLKKQEMAYNRKKRSRISHVSKVILSSHPSRAQTPVAPSLTAALAAAPDRGEGWLRNCLVTVKDLGSRPR